MERGRLLHRRRLASMISLEFGGDGLHLRRTGSTTRSPTSGLHGPYCCSPSSSLGSTLILSCGLSITHDDPQDQDENHGPMLPLLGAEEVIGGTMNHRAL